MWWLIIVFAIILLIAIFLIFTPASSPLPSTGGSEGFSAGLATDVGGINDRAFNETSWRGVGKAISDFPIEGRALVSNSITDHAAQLQRFQNERTNVIIGVGALISEAIEHAAQRSSNQQFVIIDAPSTRPNVRGIVFRVYNTAFKAGYLAAGMSRTGIVAMYGGMNIPPVVEYMEGFAAGVEHYNRVKGTSVRVLGRNTFINTFTNLEEGTRMANLFLSQGADVILPVAGPVGFATLSEISKESVAAVNSRGYVIGVDSDWAITAPQYRASVLTSILKHADIETYEAIKAAYNKAFSGGTIMSDAVSLAPYYDAPVPVSLQAEVAAL